MAKGRGRGPLPCKVLDLGDVAGLRAFRTVNDLELDRLAFLERAETVALNGRVVHEDVTASVALDEPVALGVVEPLDLACDTHRSLPACCDAASRRLTNIRDQKKRPRVCGLSLTAPGPPGVAKIILELGRYAKSPPECLRQDRYRRR